MMKAGRTLDRKLCSLLEESPANDSTVDIFNTDGVSLGGFWLRVIYSQGRYEWCPRSVSTDCSTAIEKVATALIRAGYSISMRRSSLDPWDVWIIELSWNWRNGEWGNRSGCFHSDTLPHALALAAVEVLERRAEELIALGFDFEDVEDALCQMADKIAELEK